MFGPGSGDCKAVAYEMSICGIASPLGPDARLVYRRWIEDALNLAKTKTKLRILVLSLLFLKAGIKRSPLI